MKMVNIEGKMIGKQHPPFVVAEMSGNHNQSLERALEIVEAASKSGVQAIKLQTYTADTMTLDLNEGDFFINDQDSLWNGRSLYDLYKEAYTPWEWHKPIFERCRELGLLGFSTPFDETAVDFLESLDVPCYKIASFENTDLPLIRKVAATGKPIIISTGMASVAELDETVKTARSSGCGELILLKCTSTYPASPKNTNLMTIPHMRELFNCEVGLSDHTLGIGVAVASVALGVRFIEKHFTLSRADGGVDAQFSMEPEEMRQLVIETKRAWQSMGTISYSRGELESKSLRFRRSIYISKDIQAGESLSEDNIRIIRPGYGLAPKYYDVVLGKKVNKYLKKGIPLNWEHL